LTVLIIIELFQDLDDEPPLLAEGEDVMEGEVGDEEDQDMHPLVLAAKRRGLRKRLALVNQLNGL